MYCLYCYWTVYMRYIYGINLVLDNHVRNIPRGSCLPGPGKCMFSQRLWSPPLLDLGLQTTLLPGNEHCVCLRSFKGILTSVLCLQIGQIWVQMKKQRPWAFPNFLLTGELNKVWSHDWRMRRWVGLSSIYIHIKVVVDCSWRLIGHGLRWSHRRACPARGVRGGGYKTPHLGLRSTISTIYMVDLGSTVSTTPPPLPTPPHPVSICMYVS